MHLSTDEPSLEERRGPLISSLMVIRMIRLRKGNRVYQQRSTRIGVQNRRKIIAGVFLVYYPTENHKYIDVSFYLFIFPRFFTHFEQYPSQRNRLKCYSAMWLSANAIAVLSYPSCSCTERSRRCSF